MNDPKGNDCQFWYMLGAIVLLAVMLAMIVLLITQFWLTVKIVGIVLLCGIIAAIYFFTRK